MYRKMQEFSRGLESKLWNSLNAVSLWVINHPNFLLLAAVTIWPTLFFVQHRYRPDPYQIDFIKIAGTVLIAWLGWPSHLFVFYTLWVTKTGWRHKLVAIAVLLALPFIGVYFVARWLSKTPPWIEGSRSVSRVH
ncbi:MAG: hypothetical protein WEB58_20645 [Planctomycetaceae bacterium]